MKSTQKIDTVISPVWIVPSIAKNQMVNPPDVFSNIEPTFSKSLKLIRFSSFCRTSLATRDAVTRHRRRRGRIRLWNKNTFLKTGNFWFQMLSLLSGKIPLSQILYCNRGNTIQQQPLFDHSYTRSSIIVYHFCLHAQHFCFTWMTSCMLTL